MSPWSSSQSVTQSVWTSRTIGKNAQTCRETISFSPSHATPPAPMGRGRCWSPSQLPRGQCRHFITGPHRKTNNRCKQPRTHTSGQFRLPSSPPHACSGTVGGAVRKPMQAHGEHANFAQKRPCHNMFGVLKWLNSLSAKATGFTWNSQTANYLVILIRNQT